MIRPGDSIRGLLAAIGVVAAAGILLVGVIGTTSAMRANRSVEKVIGQLGPAVTANLLVQEDLQATSASARGWVMADDADELERSRARLQRVVVDRVPLDRYAADRPELSRQIDVADAAIRAWVADYLRPSVERGGGNGTYDQQLYEIGKSRFAAVEQALAGVGVILDRDYRDALERAKASQKSTVVWGIVATLAAALLVAATGRWASFRVRRPLAHLEDVARRLAHGESGIRADPVGPREIRSVGLALNELADESERAQAVESQFQANLRGVDSARSDFVSNVSHELRTPLTLITGYLELLADNDEGNLTEEQGNMVMVARRNVMRLRELIEDLLTLNQAEHVEANLEPVDLRRVVRNAAEEMQFAAGRHGVTVSLDLPEEPVVINADGGQLIRAVINLVSNAVKFSHPGGEVHLGVGVDGDDAVIWVRDHGMGVPRADLARLGARFFRGSNAVRQEITGTGLGLRIVQTIVMAHQGSLSIDSEEDIGTEARISLPVDGPDRRA